MAVTFKADRAKTSLARDSRIYDVKRHIRIISFLPGTILVEAALGRRPAARHWKQRAQRRRCSRVLRISDGVSSGKRDGNGASLQSSQTPQRYGMSGYFFSRASPREAGVTLSSGRQGKQE